MPLWASSTDSYATTRSNNHDGIDTDVMDQATDNSSEQISNASSTACQCGCGCAVCNCDRRHLDEARSNENNQPWTNQQTVVAADAFLPDYAASMLSNSPNEMPNTFDNSFEAPGLLTRENISRVNDHTATQGSAANWLETSQLIDSNPFAYFISPVSPPEENLFHPSGEMDMDDDTNTSLQPERDVNSDARSLSQYASSFMTPSVPSGVLIRYAGMSFPGGPLRLQ